MNKKQAIKIFGNRLSDLGQALGRTKSAISQWPDELTNDQINLVIGAAVRAGKKVPKEFIANPSD
ncbi:MAG: Cro/CI family transcriptional regulator [Magnetococcus sp. YQC-3]